MLSPEARGKYLVESKSIRAYAPTTLNDEEGEKLADELDDELMLGLTAVLVRLQEKYKGQDIEFEVRA